MEIIVFLFRFPTHGGNKQSKYQCKIIDKNNNNNTNNETLTHGAQITGTISEKYAGQFKSCNF